MQEETFPGLPETEDLYALLERGLADAKAGRSRPAEEVFAGLEQEILEYEKKNRER